ncbi:DEAD/DEAH box helicase family protein, partial [Pseudomonas aeruginosa]
MKLKFKEQPYQLHAVESLADCFAGQPKSSGVSYRIDPGVGDAPLAPQQGSLAGMELQSTIASVDAGFRNAELALTQDQLLSNLQAVQRRQNLPQSAVLVNDKKTGCPINLDIEMETGTGKTYCYIRSMFELNKRYGWSKFIVVVPSIAIREGVYKSLQITA